MLTLERLREVLLYNPDDGVFTRRIRVARRSREGEVAGYVNSNGYVCLSIDGKTYKAHRLAWMYVHGSFPARHIDHIDGDRTNNRIGNLRDVSRSTNMQNQRRPHESTLTGVLGVTMDRREGCKRPYQAQIVVGGKRRHIGCFDSKEAAHQAYLVAKRRLHDGCTI